MSSGGCNWHVFSQRMAPLSLVSSLRIKFKPLENVSCITINNTVNWSWMCVTHTVFEEFQQLDYRLKYFRIPISPEQAPEDNYFDEYVRVIKSLEPTDPLIFNCGMGAVRSKYCSSDALSCHTTLNITSNSHRRHRHCSNHPSYTVAWTEPAWPIPSSWLELRWYQYPGCYCRQCTSKKYLSWIAERMGRSGYYSEPKPCTIEISLHPGARFVWQTKKELTRSWHWMAIFRAWFKNVTKISHWMGFGTWQHDWKPQGSHHGQLPCHHCAYCCIGQW